MWLRVLIGAGIGLIGGGLLGWLGKCRTGACPLTSNPFSGALFGVIIGVLLAMAIGASCSRSSGDKDGISSAADFETRVLKAGKPVLVDFYADWCGPCRTLSPVLEDLGRQYQGKADVVKVNVDNASEIAGRYNIQAIPTVILFVNGNVAGRWPGVMDASVYRQALNKAINSRG